MMTHTAAAAAFATFRVAFPAAAMVSRVDFEASRKFRAMIELFNNVSHVETSAGFATFRGTVATAQGVARYGHEVRHIAGDLYIAKRSRVGVIIGEAR